MRLHRFYVEQRVGESKELTVADQELIHQLVNVFRFKPGDETILFDGSGLVYTAEILSLNKKEVSFKLLSESVKTQPEKNVSLYLSLIKKGNFELAAEKVTEVGVAEIHPIISERSEKKDLNIERLNKIVKEASEQSGRVTLPKVFEIVSLEEAVSQVIKEGKEGRVFHTVSDSSTSPASYHLPSPTRYSSLEKEEKGDSLPSPSLVKEGAGERLCLFVGPEGGWTEKEIELFKKNNFQICSLGQNILRAETAAMVAVWGIINQ